VKPCLVPRYLRYPLASLTAEERSALEQDYRIGESRLVRQRAHIVLLAYSLPSQVEIAQAVCCSLDTVQRALALYRKGGRSAFRTRPRARTEPVRKRTLSWQKALAHAMQVGPAAGGLSRPTWTAPLLADYLKEQTGIEVDERTVRRGLESLGYVCRRPTWTVRHKAEAQPDYAPKGRGSKRS
jgi:transposase